MAKKYTFRWDYKTPPHNYRAGDEANLDDTVAEWINRDSPGVLDAPQKGVGVQASPHNRMMTAVPHTGDPVPAAPDVWVGLRKAVGTATVLAITDAGYTSPDQLKELTDAQALAIKGIGEPRWKAIKQALKMK